MGTLHSTAFHRGPVSQCVTSELPCSIHLAWHNRDVHGDVPENVQWNWRLNSKLWKKNYSGMRNIRQFQTLKSENSKWGRWKLTTGYHKCHLDHLVGKLSKPGPVGNESQRGSDIERKTERSRENLSGWAAATWTLDMRGLFVYTKLFAWNSDTQWHINSITNILYKKWTNWSCWIEIRRKVCRVQTVVTQTIWKAISHMSSLSLPHYCRNLMEFHPDLKWRPGVWDSESHSWLVTHCKDCFPTWNWLGRLAWSTGHQLVLDLRTATIAMS